MRPLFLSCCLFIAVAGRIVRRSLFLACCLFIAVAGCAVRRPYPCDDGLTISTPAQPQRVAQKTAAPEDIP